MTDPNGNGAPCRGPGLTAWEEDCDLPRAPVRRGEAIREGASTVVRIVLADDHPVVRRGLRMLLEAQGGFEVVAEAGDVGAALRKVRGYKLDVLVFDVNMPGGPSLVAIPSFLEASPGTAIVVLTMEDEPRFARQALRAGALQVAG